MTDEQRTTNQRSAEVCRRCAAAIEPDSPHAPFCSSRCRMADLGAWFSGEYRVSRELKETDLDELD